MEKNLTWKKIEELAADFSLPFCKTLEPSSFKETFRFARALGWPVVLKTASPEILHRTEKGGVVTDIRSKKELKKAWKQVSGLGGLTLLQPQIKGTELAVGMKRDPQFGPVLMFGLGGIFIEVLKDIAFRVAPVDKNEAIEMVKEIKSFKVLKGFRGREEVDLNNVADILIKLSRLVMAEEKIVEVDFNPVMANSQKALIVDAKIIYES